MRSILFHRFDLNEQLLRPCPDEWRTWIRTTDGIYIYITHGMLKRYIISLPELPHFQLLTLRPVMIFALSFVSLVVSALAAPKLHTGCNLSHAKLSVPAGQTVLTAPTSPPSFIALGVGVQNYTCNATSLTYS